jgi:hypothetical protein
MAGALENPSSRTIEKISISVQKSGQKLPGFLYIMTPAIKIKTPKPEKGKYQ